MDRNDFTRVAGDNPRRKCRSIISASQQVSASHSGNKLRLSMGLQAPNRTAKKEWRMAMFKFIDGLPKDVLAIEATGKVTHEDYESTLVPSPEAMIGNGPIRCFMSSGKSSRDLRLERFGMTARSG